MNSVPWRTGLNYDKEKMLRESICANFEQETGSEFWLKFQEEKGINFIEEVRTLEDLWKFGNPEDMTLRITRALQEKPVEYFVPKSIMQKKRNRLMLSVTGGTTGKEKTVLFDTKGVFEDYGFMGNYFLQVHNFPTFKDGYGMLYAGPTGNHYVGKSIQRMASKTNGLFYAIDMDTRIFKKLIFAQKFDVVDIYMQHIIDQMLDILKSKKVDVLVTTSKILEELYKYIDVREVGIKFIMHSGTSITPDTLKIFTEEIYKGVTMFGCYGNALFGPSFEVPRKKGDYNMCYYPNYPYISAEVVKENEPLEVVDYGEQGRILMRRFTPECFIPCYIERDVADRVKPASEYGIFWDGIMNPRQMQQGNMTMIEGIY